MSSFFLKGLTLLEKEMLRFQIEVKPPIAHFSVEYKKEKKQVREDRL